MDIEYFYRLTPRQFFNIQKGKLEIEQSRVKESWEQTRRIVFSVLQPHFKNKKLGLSDIMPLPWDIEQNSDESMSAESFEEMADRWDEIDKMKREKIDVWQV